MGRPRTRDYSDPKIVAERDKAVAWSKANRDRVNENARNWRAANREHMSKYERDRLAAEKARDPDAFRLVTRGRTLAPYGLTIAQWEAIFDAQGRQCACCGSRETGRKGWHTDHDHARGRRAVRGIVCSWCNMGLGQFDDSPAMLRRAAEYLERAALALESKCPT